MKILEKSVVFLRRFISHACVYFTLTVLLLGAAAGEGRTFSPDYFGIAVLFGALVALCDFVLLLKFIPSLFARSAIHAVLATAAFAASFVLASGIISGSTGFVATVVFFAADCSALAVRGAFISLVKKRPSETEEK